MPILATLFAGILFGAGLTVAQMTNPAKVLDFLDIAAIRTGGWDPTLLMVFVGALPTMFAAYAIQRRMGQPLVAPVFMVPKPSPIDRSLLVGSALFGIGWGMAGICPGPAITALAPLGGRIDRVALFVAAMLAGIWLSRLLRQSWLTATQART